MKFWFFVLLAAFATSVVAADKSEPPNPRQAAQLFFEHINQPLKNEPQCQMRQCGGRICKTLAEYVSFLYGDLTTIRESDPEEARLKRVSILMECDPELHDNIPIADGTTSGWNCSVFFRANDIDGPKPWISQSTIQMTIQQDLKGVVPGTIICR